MQQSQDTGRPEELLLKCKKVLVKGADAWIYGKTNTQLMFWKDGMYYNLASEHIPVEELIKIAESLK